MNASEHYQAGELTEAIQAQTEEVKSKPADADARAFLAELLAIDGNLERADKLLEAVSTQMPEHAMGVALFRQLVHAEQWRQDFFTSGRVPEILENPGAEIEARMKAAVLLRDGDATAAMAALEQAEEARGECPHVVNGGEVSDLRDGDDLIGGVLELLTSTGKYFWVSLASVTHMQFHTPERPRDLIWRRATIDVKDGPDGEVFIPAIYWAPSGDASAAQKLGRETDWIGEEGKAPIRGAGLRTYLVGEEAKTIFELEEVGREEAPS